MPATPRTQQVAVTRLARALAQGEDDEPALPRPAVRAADRQDGSRRVAGYQVGNLVHRALAEWLCNKIFIKINSIVARLKEEGA